MQSWRSSNHYIGEVSVDVEVTGSLLPSFLFFSASPPHPPKRRTAERTVADVAPPGYYTQPCLFCCGSFCGREAAYPTLSSMFVNIWFSQKTKKGKSSGIQQKVRTAIFLPGPASFYTLTSGTHYQNKWEQFQAAAEEEDFLFSDDTVINGNTGTKAQNNAAIEIDLWHLLCRLKV